uniref:Protein FAM228A n=1 Tax=Felis catus TaxID=9685 RepID=A0ABI7X075_FELCA
MASKKVSTCGEHFRPEKLKEWPELESVALMEALAREDIDEAVHAILFRENYIAKVMLPLFCDSPFRRWQEMDEEKRAVFQNKAGKRYTLKECKDLEKARLCATLPHFTFTLHDVILRHKQMMNKNAKKKKDSFSLCPSSLLVLSLKKKKKRKRKEKTIFERQFHSSKLSQENGREERNCVVSRDLGEQGWDGTSCNMHKMTGIDFGI